MVSYYRMGLRDRRSRTDAISHFDRRGHQASLTEDALVEVSRGRRYIYGRWDRNFGFWTDDGDEIREGIPLHHYLFSDTANLFHRR